MEKITCQPLVSLLQENAEALNQSVRQAAAASGRFDPAAVPAWFKSVIEPVFESVHKHDKTRSRKVFDVLFRDMLDCLRSGTAGDELELHRSCRLLLLAGSSLTAANPSRMLKSLTSALKKIMRCSHAATRTWLGMMQKIVAAAASLDELLAAGRFAAWRCGMAHLRLHLDFSQQLNPDISSVIFDDSAFGPDLQRPWYSAEKTVAKAAGSFVGFGGEFMRPPRLTLRDNLVFVSDGLQTRVLFADRFGSVLLECPEVFDGSADFALNPVTTAPSAAAKILGRYKDLTAWVYHDSTLFLTTASSHSVFLFGAVDG